MRVKRWKLLHTVIRTNGTDKILWSFLANFLVIAWLIQLLDAGVTHYVDALWYCFSVVTTIGFGDVLVTAGLARVLTVVLSVNAILVIAILTGTVVNYFSEMQKAHLNESITLFLDKLEHLDSLSKEELSELSANVRKMRK